MKRYYYDLHIHSCLSPCADDMSTPDSIAGMGELNGLNIIALTDHNSCKNCPAFFAAAKRHGILPIAGMELTTAEDIHAVCLFDGLENAMRFDAYLQSRRMLIQNRTDIFGRQLICDSEDHITGEEPHLLSNATDISLEEAPQLMEEYGGVCYPAHIDREANGVISVLGVFPKTPKFSCAELHDPQKKEKITAQEDLFQTRIIISSDAHYLWDIKEQTDFFETDRELCFENVGQWLIRYLREGL